jgi:alpha-ketoglutarate-dependent taurine dioxygenase
MTLGPENPYEEIKTMTADVAELTRLGFEVVPSGKPLGAEIRGVNLAEEYSQEVIDGIRAAINEYSVIYFRDQDLSVEDQIRFTRLFGEPEKHILHKQYGVKGYEEALWIGNVKEGDRFIGVNDGALKWHSDLSYKTEPSTYSVLYALEVPHDENGKPLGDTRFVSMKHAYRTVSPEMRERLTGLKAIHRYGDQFAERMKKKREAGEHRNDLDEQQLASVPDVAHPMIRTLPSTGEKSLFIDEWFTVSIEGMPDKEGRALLDELISHSIQPANVYSHKWQVGDLLMWDNPSSMHIATFDFTPAQRRLLRRTTCKGAAVY